MAGILLSFLLPALIPAGVPAEPPLRWQEKISFPRDGALRVAGGRVVGVSAVGATLPEAREKAYLAAGTVQGEDLFFRRDIGA